MKIEFSTAERFFIGKAQDRASAAMADLRAAFKAVLGDRGIDEADAEPLAGDDGYCIGATLSDPDEPQEQED